MPGGRLRDGGVQIPLTDLARELRRELRDLRDPAWDLAWELRAAPVGSSAPRRWDLVLGTTVADRSMVLALR